MAHKNYMLNDEFPKAIKNATSTSDGLMSSEDKANLDSIFEFGYLTPVSEYKDGVMTKEDKIKLDSVEENANNYIHPDDETVRHVTDDQINRWDRQVKYTNTTPSTVDVGGIKSGTIFENMDYKQIFDAIFHPYVDPSIYEISITPSNSIYEAGQQILLSKVQFKIKAPSSGDTDKFNLDFRLNNKNIYNLVDITSKNIDINLSNQITENTTFSVIITDNFNKSKTFNLKTYTFVNPTFYGVINIDDELDQSTICSKTKIVQTKSNRSLSFTTKNQKMIYAYPKSYGKLKSIHDLNNFDLSTGFNISEVTLNLAGIDTVYYVYINDASTVTDYTVNFIF